MGLQSKQKEIDGHVYQVTTLPAKRGMDLFGDLVKILGPAFGALAGGANDTTSVLDIPLGESGLTKAALLLADRYDNEKVLKIVNILAQVTTVNGKPLEPQFDIHFAGAFGSLFKWLAFALEVNFGDFLSVLSARGQAALLVQADQKSPGA